MKRQMPAQVFPYFFMPYDDDLPDEPTAGKLMRPFRCWHGFCMCVDSWHVLADACQIVH